MTEQVMIKPPKCPRCGTRLESTTATDGWVHRCPKCGYEVHI